MIRILLLSAALALALPVPATVAQTQQSDVVSATILPGWRTERGTYMAAIRFTLAPDWKTYWRSPGDAGIPPLFNWSGSTNLAAVQVHWPRPHVFTVNGMQSIGYKHELVLPIELTPADRARPIELRATIDLGVCLDICVPATVALATHIEGAGQAHPDIRTALANRPSTASEAGLAGIGCAVDPIADGLRLTATLSLPDTGGAETVVFEPTAGAIWVSEATVTRAGGLLTASADLVADSGGPFALDRSNIVVTVLGRDRAVEINGCPAP